MKRKTFFIIVICILFLNLLSDIIPSNYKKKYKVNNYNITEQYNKSRKLYTFIIKSKEDTFDISLSNKYVHKKRLIKKISKIKINSGYCLVPTGKSLDFYPVCIQNNKFKSYHLINELKGKVSNDYYPTIKTESNSYENIDINYLNNQKYLLWNYRYFDYITDEEYKRIDLFETDYYQIDLVTLVDDHLFIPNYDDGYFFKSAYIINMKNGETKKWDINKSISTESRVIGVYNKSIFLIDEKSEILYEIVPHKMRIREVEGKILEGNKFKKYSIKTIINNKLSFKYDNNYNFQVVNNKLYLVNKTKTLLTDDNITNIITSYDDTVYYLKDNGLYMYNNKYGNILLMRNFEWSFNYNNMIFIY